MFTTQMVRLFAVVLSRDAQKVAEELLRAGVMQFINISQVKGSISEKLEDAEETVSLTETADIRKRIEELLHTLGIYPDAPKEIDLHNRCSINVREVTGKLDTLTGEREHIREKQRILGQEILKLEDIKRQVELYSSGISDLTLTSQHSFISIQIGKLPTAHLRRLGSEMKEIPSVNLPVGEENDATHLLIISMKRDAKRVSEILDNLGWSRIELPREMGTLKSDIAHDLSEKLSKLIDEQKKLGNAANELIKRESPWLKETWVRLRINELIFRIQTYFKHSSRTTIFSGWLPVSKKVPLTKKIRQASEGRCYLEWYDADDTYSPTVKAPVQFRNPKIFAPFQMLVANFGIPEYGTIDPTVVVMPVYLIMFGVMFADVGQGAILALLGYLGALFFKKKKKENFVTLSHLMVWCGCSSVLFGILFGSYFGMGLLKPLWFDFHGIVSGHSNINSPVQDIFDILKITIFFGVTVIILGLIFNWINLIRKKQWIELFFEKGGIIGGWIYLSGVYIGYVMATNNYQFPSPTLFFGLVGLPALLLFIKEPLHFVKHKNMEKNKKHTPFIMIAKSAEFIMTWSVELLEIFSGYLSNTLSFMRVAGLGIAHVSLMISFFALADMAGGKGIAPVCILVAGNILVIALEGLSAGVQALRLNYYEFFTKFFHGTGKLYSPVSLTSHDS